MKKARNKIQFGDQEPKVNLTAAELDRELQGSEQSQLRKLVRELPEESVSMVWRSALNEKLMAIAAYQRKRRRVIWVLRPALGIGLAGVMALTFVVIRGTHEVPKSHRASVEAALVGVHRDAVLADDVAGTGLTAIEVDQDADGDVKSDFQTSEQDPEG